MGGAMMGLMLATQRAFVQGLPTGRRVGRQAVSPRLADGGWRGGTQERSRKGGV